MESKLFAPANITELAASCHSNTHSNGHVPHFNSPETWTILKLFGNSLQIWKHKYAGRSISYKLCLVDIKRKDSEVELKLDDVSSQLAEYVNQSSNVQIAVLNETDCQFANQDQFGRCFDPSEYVFLKAKIDDINKWAYMVDYYVRDKNINGPAEHIGYSYILPLNLQENKGTIKTVITGINHKPIGHLMVDYLIVKPLEGISKPVSSNQKWTQFKQGMEVGHRGAGKWRRNDRIENVLENTIASFNYAAKHGADMVELDVHLSKDKVPVIYHDFNITISIKKRITSSDPDLSTDAVRVTHAVKELTLQELQLLKLSPVNNLNHDFQDSDPLENQPFPTLKQVLESVSPQCGFNVEVKYPQMKNDGTWEGSSYGYDENEFVDIILRTVLEHAGDRNIIFSTFHPDICTLLRLKQNVYPVLFLTQGKTQRYLWFNDPRTCSVENATFLAKCFDFWGINAHAEDLLRERSLIQFVKRYGLILFTWGEDINSTSVVHQLKNDGVDGIIFDKIDVYNTKFVAENPDIDEIKKQQDQVMEAEADQNNLLINNAPPTISQQSTMVQ